jgi:type II secretory pathway pseudopilin PulG
MAAVMIALLALVLVVVVLGLSRQARHDLESLQASAHWQCEQARRVAEGWTPTLWEEEANEDEKAEAIRRYLEE